MLVFMLIMHNVPSQETAYDGKQNGNDDEVYLLDTGSEVVMHGKKLFDLDIKQSEEKKL
jgi:hypothetical protein